MSSYGSALPNRLRWSTAGSFSSAPLGTSTARLAAKRIQAATEKRENELAKLQERLADRSSHAATGIASFMAVVATIDPPFKPRTPHRPWSISAGHGAHGSVEVHRYVPGRNFNVFNDSSEIKLLAYEPDMTRTGDYYAVKRLASLDDSPASSSPSSPSSSSRRNAFALLADELRILAHPDLRGHPNLVYLFGVSHTPSRGGSSATATGLTEPNLVLQEGDCGDLYSFYRDVDMRFDRHTLPEVKLSLCFDIARGVEALHHHGVVHCDLKPQNILIRRRQGRNGAVLRCKSELEAGQVALDALVGKSPFVAMLADFGGSIIMADFPDNDREGTGIRPRVFTPRWCAPECHSRAEIPRALLPRVDIYSAGLIFAFIFLEGRDVFTQAVDRGAMHEHDVPLDDKTVRALKMSDRVLELAQEEVRGFETTAFGVTATGQRLYVSRHPCYHPAVADVFCAVLELALKTDAGARVENATDLLAPWHRALQGNFHVDNQLSYSQPEAFRAFASGRMGGKDYFSTGNVCARSQGEQCSKVLPAFPGGLSDINCGVFDIRKSFSVFRASLTSNLKTDINNDLKQDAEIVKSLQQLVVPPRRIEDLVTPSQLKRAADCAYQLCVACLEGFGRPRDDSEALEWMRLAAEWGSIAARADLLPLSVSLGKAPSDSTDANLSWASYTISQGESHQGTVQALHKVNPDACAEAIAKHRARVCEKLSRAHKPQTRPGWVAGRFGLQQRGPPHLHMLEKYQSISAGGMPALLLKGGWTALHCAVLEPSRTSVIGGATINEALVKVQTLVETDGEDVRRLTLADSYTALDLAMGRGDVEMVRYLLSQHRLLEPPFRPRTCPLQNVACLPEDVIEEVVDAVVSMAPELAIHGRNPTTGRTALLNVLLTKDPVLPAGRSAAIKSLLESGANPLARTTMEPWPASALLAAVGDLDVASVNLMLEAIGLLGHATPAATAARPEPANELVCAFLRLMQKPRSVQLTRDVAAYKHDLGATVKLVLGADVAAELPHVCRGVRHDVLGLACYYGQDETMQAILDAVPPSARTTHPATARTLGPGDGGVDALKTAIDCGFAAAVDLLLPLMAGRREIGARDLLLHGAMHHQPALVPGLLAHFERAGREPEVLEFQDQWGATVLDLALEYGNFDLARHLVSRGARHDVYRLKGDHSIDEGLQSPLAAALPRMESIRFLMGLTPAPSLVVTSTGLNVFHVLAAEEKLIGTTVGRAEFLRVLEYFYNLDPTLIHARGGTRGLTPLHIVSLHYSETVGAFLHQHGADVNAESAVGSHSPLDVLHLHEDGDRGPDNHLTIDYRGPGGPRTGMAICDYGMAGPAYWKLEARLAARLRELYGLWGAERGVEWRMQRLGLSRSDLLFGGAITAYEEGADGRTRVMTYTS
ncbi:serine/threonine protein kinase [Gaeumannomyces tritici R3-111a-1]|uniref:Serine/threonine protein kinase n=1 Tax=Gaeumannomyces tritici (strain R3-111a-1) TaxID=644352 RepID=J3PHS3_GAET3|nr:serine/threonine protein kinase [Gaeumannomyces tritici R3-111a-1]EJT69435.1 serine/threonine protein kinase [Gaeumannomyces tritici R3-111a-1]